MIQEIIIISLILIGLGTTDLAENKEAIIEKIEIKEDKCIEAPFYDESFLYLEPEPREAAYGWQEVIECQRKNYICTTSDGNKYNPSKTIDDWKCYWLVSIYDTRRDPKEIWMKHKEGDTI